jgi:uncharacterized protein DUF1918
MPKPGDRVVVEGTKVGGGRREGTLLELSGSLMRVRWEDGGETFMAPGAGAVRFVTGSGRGNAGSGAKPKPKPKPKAPAAKAKTKAAAPKAKGKKK